MRLRRIAGADEAVAQSPHVVHNSAEVRGHWQEEFPREQPLYLEIGMGKGRFLMDMARLHPEINFLGIERYTSVLYRALQKMDAREEPLTNIRFLCVDAAELPEIFAPGEIDRIYLNFSDPWPKARHADRRLTANPFLERYDKVLAEGGQIEFKTDNRGLFDFSVETADVSPLWQIKARTYDLHHDALMNAGNVMTEYEAKFSAKGNPICKMILVRRS